MQTEVITLAEFTNLKPVKHNSELTSYDIVLLAVDSHDIHKGFERVVCTGYCGKDEFWGRNEDGKRRAWCDNDTFKIIGKQISL